MNFRPMNQQDFEFWSLRSRMTYAQSKIKANGVPRDEAVKAANAEFERHLPKGLETENNFFYSAIVEEKRVGFLWVQIRGKEPNRQLYVCDIIVEPDQRGRGYGREIMVHAEKEATRLGLTKIGLHVFGYNETAIKLYQSLGYATVDLVMEKSLA